MRIYGPDVVHLLELLLLLSEAGSGLSVTGSREAREEAGSWKGVDGVGFSQALGKDEFRDV